MAVRRPNQIITVYENPVSIEPYSNRFAYETEVNKQIEEMLQQCNIRESYFPYCSPLWIV